MHCVISIRRRIRACTRLLVAAKALATRDYVRDISSNKRHEGRHIEVDGICNKLL
jgi:hypothetical protein